MRKPQATPYRPRIGRKPLKWILPTGMKASFRQTQRKGILLHVLAMSQRHIHAKRRPRKAMAILNIRTKLRIGITGGINKNYFV